MAGGVIQPGKDRGVNPGRKRRSYGRFEIVDRRETRSGQFGGLSRIVLPVIISEEESSIPIAQLQRGIFQQIGHTRGGEAGSEAANYDSVRSGVVTQDEARDNDIAACPDKGTGTDVGQFRGGFVIEVVDFDQADTGLATVPSHHSGIRSRSQRRNDR